MQLQEEDQSCVIHCCVQTGLLLPDVLQAFRLAFGSAACFLSSVFLALCIVLCANGFLHSPCSYLIASLSLGLVLVCVIIV